MKYKGRNDVGGSGEERGGGRLLDYLMEFLSSPCYIERAEKWNRTGEFGTRYCREASAVLSASHTVSSA
jgi:hypothetical protein